MINWDTLINLDPWKYFKLPPEEEMRLCGLFAVKVGPNGLGKLMDRILYDQTFDDPKGNPHKFIPGIGDAKQIAGATLYIVGDFIGQYHKLGWRYKVPLLPKEIMVFFRPPYNEFQDMNLRNQRKVVKALNKKHKRGLSLHHGI